MPEATLAVAELAQFLNEVGREVREREPRYAFPREEYEQRWQRLRAGMERESLDLLLIFSMDAIAWAHGLQLRWYKASSPRQWPPLACTALHIDHGEPIVFEGIEHRDLLHERSVARDVRFTDRDGDESKLDVHLSELRAEGWLRGRVGIEMHSYLPNPAIYRVLETELVGAGCEVVDATDLIRGVRRVKSPRELEVIEEAAAICDAGLLHLQRVLRPGMTELEAWGEMMLAMAREGGEPAAIHEMVSIGDVHRNHAWASTRKIVEGEVLWADPSGVRHRYHANIARSFVVGEMPAAARRIGEIEGGAYEVLCSVARPGARVGDVASTLRDYYQDAGVWELRDSGWVGAYELGLSFPPDWVGDFCWTVGEDDRDDTIEPNSVSNFESVIGLPMIDTIIYGEHETRALSRVARETLIALG